jgi:hypothetical protein
VQAPALHPAHETHEPPGHWLSAVHQHATPAELHVPAGVATSLQLPIGHAKAVGAAVMITQFVGSGSPVPLHGLEPASVVGHWPELTHWPVEH